MTQTPRACLGPAIISSERHVFTALKNLVNSLPEAGTVTHLEPMLRKRLGRNFSLTLADSNTGPAWEIRRFTQVGTEAALCTIKLKTRIRLQLPLSQYGPAVPRKKCGGKICPTGHTCKRNRPCGHSAITFNAL